MASSLNGTGITFSDATTLSSVPVTSLNGQTGVITNTSVNAIGSYVYSFTNTDVAKGGTTAGSNLLSFSLSGTWRNMGYSSAPSGTPCVFVRVS